MDLLSLFFQKFSAQSMLLLKRLVAPRGIVGFKGKGSRIIL